MKATVERELKLAPGEGFVLPELGGEPLPTRVFTSTYHDTPELTLARHGVTLRHRVEDGAGAWQLKLPQGASRIELELPGPPARPPAELSALLVAFLRGSGLAPVARLRTRRETVRVDGAEIVDDFVSVLDGQHVTQRFRELEIELTGGDEATLRRLVEELRRAGATAADGALRPKLHRALGIAPAAAPATVGRHTAPVDALGAALAEQARRLLLHDPGVRLGADPEDVHQLRVATRRLRAFLRAGRPLLDLSWARPLRDEIGWLGGALGPARDLDVLLERLRGDVASLGGDAGAAAGLLASLEAEREQAYGASVQALSSDRYLALLDRLDAVGTPVARGDGPSLRDLCRREWRRTRRALDGLDAQTPDAELHRGRIDVKRVRYAAELAAHELGKPAGRFVERAKRLQDVLGEHQDATVAEERIRAWGAGDGDRAVADRLVEREHARKAAARAAWPEAWRELRRAAKSLA